MSAKRYITLALFAALAFAVLVGLIKQPFVGPSAVESIDVDEAKLKRHVKHLSVDLYPRSFEQFRNIERAAEYIHRQFSTIGAEVSVQDVSVQEATYKNVIARFGPPDGPLLVVGAHYDSHGDASEGAKYNSGFTTDTHTPGADDNASGVAALLELARLLQQHPPAHPVELVAYALEEPPHFRTQHMGSAWHARSLVASNQEVRLMLALEMIGFYSDKDESQTYPVSGMNIFYPARADFIALVGRFGDFGITRLVKSIMLGASELPVFSINAPSLIPGIDFSDHISFWNAGYPALMITDTAFYRNPNYHRAGDTYEKLDYTRMAQVVKAVYAVVQHY